MPVNMVPPLAQCIYIYIYIHVYIYIYIVQVPGTWHQVPGTSTMFRTMFRTDLFRTMYENNIDSRIGQVQLLVVG